MAIIKGNKLANTLLGTTDTDRIFGLAGNDKLFGADGNDALYGGLGNDKLYGGAGDDTFDGGAGRDKFYGGAGSDTVSFAKAAAGVEANLGAKTGSGGEAQGDYYNSIENVTGTKFADTLKGSSSANVIIGGAGADELTGGGGADHFVYLAVRDFGGRSANDSIRDFHQSQGDKIDISALPGTFKFVGNDLFSGNGTPAVGTHIVAPDTTAAFTEIDIDSNGDGIPDGRIDLAGAVNLRASDFIL